MTSLSLRRRVLEQLASYPPGQPVTAAGLAHGMDGKVPAADAERALDGLNRDGLVVPTRMTGRTRFWEITSAGRREVRDGQ